MGCLVQNITPIPFHPDGFWFHTKHLYSLTPDYLLVSSPFLYVGMAGLPSSDTQPFNFIPVAKS